MTILDDVYDVIPGAQVPSPASTSQYATVAHGLGTWMDLLQVPNYNAPSATPPSKDFSLLNGLVAQAEQDDRAWAADTDEDRAEQRENATLLRAAQLDTIAERDD